ncbi:nicotinamide riboside transporter PnuC [Moraxella oblonga]|uniref:nicotinamide riboside transporter PnuC n=1 Tax=Moraxella oblonga TaxID=200413 RepID=UPI00082E6F30|nr:nicotinamide riboside transporter PnuC [Moraxella oblonga]
MDFIVQLFSQYETYTPLLMTLEFIATFCGVVSVILVGRGNILAYPIGLISTTLYVYLLWQWQLFGDMLINAYYTAMSIYGWVNWSKHKNHDVAIIETTTKKEWFIGTWIVIATFIFVGIVYYFKPFINNNFSFDNITLGFYNYALADYTDMLTTALFLVAMWLMAKRKIEHWIIWIIADAISIPLYFYKGMLFTSIQYTLFTIIAIISYFSWKRLLKIQNVYDNTNQATH